MAKPVIHHVFMMVQDEQIFLTLNEHDLLPCFRRRHIPHVYFPESWCRGRARSERNAWLPSSLSTSTHRKVLLHSGRISHCLKQVSHHGNLFPYSYLPLLLNILSNSIRGTNENSKSKQKGDNAA